MVNHDTTRSDKILNKFLNRTQALEQIRMNFSGTCETDIDTFFALLCPAREADWIPGWNAEVLHSDNGGKTAIDCIFQTDKSNVFGEGVWIFTDVIKNKCVDLVRVSKNLTMHLKVDVKVNDDGTVTSAWNIVASALNQKGNKEVASLKKHVGIESTVLPKIIEHYLKTGKQMNKASLGVSIVANKLKNLTSSGHQF
ncbi:MAG: hypothetical protein MJA31_02050 [Clostridia bacterium]|nr:hypothetical protein [Clostridia bacterium]